MRPKSRNHAEFFPVRPDIFMHFSALRPAPKHACFPSQNRVVIRFALTPKSDVFAKCTPGTLFE
jgi:hypothetical protein